MSNHLKRFTNHNNYNAHISTGAAVLPNVCVCDNESEIHYNKFELITFRISELEYQAESGMTWEDWVNSKYNIDNYWHIGNNIIYAGHAIISNVQPSDIIISKTYTVYGGGGGSND